MRIARRRRGRRVGGGWDGEGRVEGLTCTSAAAGGGSTVVIVSTLLGGKLIRFASGSCVTTSAEAAVQGAAGAPGVSGITRRTDR